MNEENQAMRFKPTLWQRLMIWFFPYNHEELPDEQEGMSYGVNITTLVNLDWKDRIRVLISGAVLVEIRKFTENNPGMQADYAKVSILQPGPVTRRIDHGNREHNA